MPLTFEELLVLNIKTSVTIKRTFFKNTSREWTETNKAIVNCKNNEVICFANAIDKCCIHSSLQLWKKDEEDGIFYQYSKKPPRLHSWEIFIDEEPLDLVHYSYQ